jgi:hypothetical protein
MLSYFSGCLESLNYFNIPGSLPFIFYSGETFKHTISKLKLLIKFPLEFTDLIKTQHINTFPRKLSNFFQTFYKIMSCRIPLHICKFHDNYKLNFFLEYAMCNFNFLQNGVIGLRHCLISGKTLMFRKLKPYQ